MTDPVIAERIAKDCLMFPPTAASLARLAKMADTAVSTGSTNKDWPYFQFVKGLAEFRLGHFAAAGEWLDKVAVQSTASARDAEAYATLAMAKYQSGQTNAARSALAESIKTVETKLNRPDRLDWNDQIIAKVLLREAHTVVMGQPPPADVLK